MKRLLLASVLLTGCEMLVPNGNKKPNPQPDASPVPEQKQRLEIVLKFDNEGRIQLAGDSTINLRSNPSATTQFPCGCDKVGCNCGTRDIPGNASTPVKSGGNADAAASDRSAGDVFNKPLKTNRDIFVLSTQGCAACDLAAADMRKLGFDVHVVYDQQARQYPTLKNRRGDVYEIDDGYWNTGDDDIRAAKKLGQ